MCLLAATKNFSDIISVVSLLKARAVLRAKNQFAKLLSLGSKVAVGTFFGNEQALEIWG